MRVIVWAAILPLLYLWTGGPQGIAKAALEAGGYDAALQQEYSDIKAENMRLFLSGGAEREVPLSGSPRGEKPDYRVAAMLALLGAVIGATANVLPRPWGARPDDKRRQQGDSAAS